jgi:hypothetical protein
MESSQNLTNIQFMVNSFYEFAANVYIDYKQKEPIYIVKSVPSESSIATPNGEEIEIKREQTFQEYLLFQLFYNYGVKRRMVNEHIAILYYDKSLKGYKATSPITMLCRHMMLNLNNLRIVSLGVPKATPLETFCQNYGVNMDSAESSPASSYGFYEFLEGTMITYNPSLVKYNIEHINANSGVDEEVAETDANLESVKATISNEFNKTFMYSTRRVVGTGCFSSMKTFLQMFEENNQLAGISLESLPSEVTNDTVLVFNIEHPDNKLISKVPINRNTLVGVYKFKPELQTSDEFNLINSFSQEQSDSIKQSFQQLANGMVIQIGVQDFVNQFPNIHIQTPKRIFNIQDADNVVTSLENTSINNLKMVISGFPDEFQGVMIYSNTGERSKISNNKYKTLCKLKGAKPIVIEEWNLKNLFSMYWRLVKTNQIAEFLAKFEIINSDKTYKKLFDWFAFILNGFSMNLFKAYHYSFVKRIMQKEAIPYAMKPMCGDLHTQYMANRIPISKTMVDSYISNQPASKIFWRLFTPNMNVVIPTRY